jgi:hypothetical protein
VRKSKQNLQLSEGERVLAWIVVLDHLSKHVEVEVVQDIIL